MVIDLKDCFFSIPLQPQNYKKIAFIIPKYSNKQPTQKYQWKVLPQVMLNSPTLCQKFIHRTLNPVKNQFPTVLIYHYMNDILLATPM